MNKSSKFNSIPISKLIHNNNFPIADLYKKGQAIIEIDSKLKLKLDPSLQNNFEVANINSESALLLVSSSVWATRLRYNIPTILTVLNNLVGHKTKIKSVRIKVKQPVVLPHDENTRSFNLSDKSAKFLYNIAQTINDPELSECFKKLSMHRS